MTRDEALEHVKQEIRHPGIGKPADLIEALRVLSKPCIEVEGLEPILDYTVGYSGVDSCEWNAVFGDRVIVLRRRA